jgi:hypothetical protein
VSRCTALALTILATSTFCAGLLALSPSPAQASDSAAKLHDARRNLRVTQSELSVVKRDYAWFKTSGARRGGGWYTRNIRSLKQRIGGLRLTIARLQASIAAKRVRRAAASGSWMPLIRTIAKENHISASGLYRLMSLESGGRATASSGTYHGLYQYCVSTWKAAWNPWRSRSIYDGEAQIRATARAIKKGWGHRMWPNTYPMAF